MQTPSPSVSSAPDRSTSYSGAPPNAGEDVAGGTLVVWAYAFVWIIVLLAVVRVFMRQSDVRKRVDELEAKIASKAKK